MNVILAGEFEFPDGGAATARIRNIAAALEELGHKVHLLPLALPYKESESDVRIVHYKGNQFYTVLPSPSVLEIRGNPKSLTGKMRWFRETNARALRFSRWLNSSGLKADLLILYGRSYVRLRNIQHWACQKAIPCLIDVTEGAERFSGFGGVINPIYWDWRIGEKYLIRNSQLISAISTGLAARAIANGAKSVTVVPPIESWRDLPSIEETILKDKSRLVVFGSLTAKDAPALLEKVIGGLARSDSKIRVELVGRYQDTCAGAEWARRLCLLSNRSTEVISHGEVGNKDLRRLLGSADGYLMLRPNSLAERLAFPTRIVELLKYGRPLLVSDVGDVKLYLKNDIHAFLLPPGDPTQIISRLQHVRDASALWKKVGTDGRIQATKCFDRVQCVKKLLSKLKDRGKAEPNYEHDDEK